MCANGYMDELTSGWRDKGKWYTDGGGKRERGKWANVCRISLLIPAVTVTITAGSWPVRGPQAPNWRPRLKGLLSVGA